MPIRSVHRVLSAARSSHSTPFESSQNMNTVKCYGCDMVIFDRYIMTVLDRGWHADCLRCYQCQCPLQEKCFSRNDKLFCRDDFFRMFGIKCYGCGNGICPDELVQRSPRGDIYHLRCFICAICRKPLTTGNELYIINDGEFICKDDYNIKHRISSNIAETELDSPAATKSPAFDLAPGETLDLDQQERAVGTGATSTAAGGNGCLEAVAEDEDEEDMKASTNSETASHRCSVPPADRDCCDKDSKSLCGDDESGDEDETRNDENNISTKRRGPRTTIKAKQLELLKTAFSQTPKPTRHIREQLAQETGLTMRVIQVWFQNRRSKERRMKQLTAMGNPRRNNMFRPRRSGVRSLREFDGDSGDLLGAPGGGPGFAFYPDGPGNHPGDFFPGHPHGSVAGAGGGAGGGPHAHPHPPGMFEFHHFPPRHPQNINENMAHFGDMSGSGHGLPGGMSHGPEAHFGRPDLMSQNSSPNSMTSDGYGHPGFDPLHNHPGNPVPGSDSPVWQSMAMAQ